MASLKLPKWTDDQIRADATKALTGFIKARTEEAGGKYRSHYDEGYQILLDLFDKTDDLTSFAEGPLKDKGRRAAARFLAGPPWSKDDLKTLVQAQAGPEADAAAKAKATLYVLKLGWDLRRFPWLQTGGRPNAMARKLAISQTAAIWAVERTRTSSRVDRSKKQENLVQGTLEAAGYAKINAEKGTALDPLTLPKGTFAKGIAVGGRRCDFAIRTKSDGIMIIECKYAGSRANAFKRIIHEGSSKKTAWSAGGQNATVSVLGGVFRAENVFTLQNEIGMLVLWDHDLSPLAAVL